ncbi:ABC transporter permease [Dermatobacter hominis]|uniref:ABC transporter permease n=1 Tax=Dermatobacter hominis TaxID=2884263 RepID=UPI001D0FFC9E|nr:ABC transporter permease [Dermatobacter hominis]UDY37268.1 ABC transporter permease [Dermatobacter hominis]
MNLLTEIFSGGVRGSTSIAYAALGETISERAGVVNLGTEGCMLAGACAGYAVAAQSGSPWLGAIGGAVAGGLLSLVVAFFVLSRGANQLATGLVVLFLALGLTSLFGVAYVSQTITPFEIVDLPLLGSIPFVGEVFFQQDPLTYLVYLLVPATWWLLFRSRWGLLLRGVGERTEVLATYGHRVLPVQYAGVVLGGVLAGIGGAQLSTAYANAWFENMIQGRGFIAVAVVIFANRRPVPVWAGSFLFGTALALSPALQSRGYSVNQFALHAIPYATTILALMVLAKRQAEDTPEGLRKVFDLSPVS